MLSEPNISYKPFWGICRPLNSWRANSPNPIQICCAYVLDAQNAGLAKGGSGDILCGIVVAMLGQCKDPMQAALCATYIHSQSAKLDIDLASFMPENIINNIPNTLKRLRS